MWDVRSVAELVHWWQKHLRIDPPQVHPSSHTQSQFTQSSHNGRVCDACRAFLAQTAANPSKKSLNANEQRELAMRMEKKQMSQFMNV